MSSIDRFVSRARYSILRSIVRLTDGFPADAPIQHGFLLRQLAASIPSSLTRGVRNGISEPDSERVQVCESATLSLTTFLYRAVEEGHASAEDIEPILERVDDIGRIARSLRDRSAPTLAA